MNAPDTEAVEGWKSRWRLCLCCQTCNAVFEVDPDSLSVSLEQTRAFTRIVALPVPEGCPKCRNLQLVQGPKRG